jgi:hypothetical protein
MGQLLFYIKPMHPALWRGCFIKDRGLSLIVENKRRSCAILRLALKPKKDEEALMRVTTSSR